MNSVNVDFVKARYGKDKVRLMHVKKEGSVHHITEVQVNTALSLNSKKDYEVGDNSAIVATDSQKNTVYVLAKKYGVECPETFALLLSDHFLKKYTHVTSSRIYIEQHPWRRIVKDGKDHVHAFISCPESVHYCLIEQKQGGKLKVTSGIRGLRVIKTTQSAFINFVKDEFTALPDMADRIFSTEMKAKWEYSTTEGVKFTKAWEIVRDTIIDCFAGPPDTGVYSPSVQQTLYIAVKRVLNKIPQINVMELELPNIHYYAVDYSKLPGVGISDNNEIFLPSDQPSGNIYAKVVRKSDSKL